MRISILLVLPLLTACGGVYAPPTPDADVPAEAEAIPDASPDQAEAAPACNKPLLCDPAIGWFDPCAQKVLGCPDGTTTCCMPVPGCYCAGTGGGQGSGRFTCEDGGDQSDELSCLHCGTHCKDGGP